MKEKCTVIVLGVFLPLIFFIKFNFIVPNVKETHVYRLSDAIYLKVQDNASTLHCKVILKARCKKKQLRDIRHYIPLSAFDRSWKLLIQIYSIHSCKRFIRSYCLNTSGNSIDTNGTKYSEYKRRHCKVTQIIPNYVVTFMVAIVLFKLFVVVFAYQQLLYNGYDIIQNLYQKYLNHFQSLICSLLYHQKSGHGLDAEENNFGYKYQNQERHRARQAFKKQINETLQFLRPVNKYVEFNISHRNRSVNNNDSTDQQYSSIHKDKTKMLSFKSFNTTNLLYHQQLPLKDPHFSKLCSHSHHRRIKHQQNHQFYQFYFARNSYCFLHRNYHDLGLFHHLETKCMNGSHIYFIASILYGKSYFESKISHIFLRKNFLATSSSSKLIKLKTTSSVFMKRMIRSCGNHIENIPNYHPSISSLTSMSSTISCWKTCANRKRRKRKFSFIWDKNEYVRNCKYLVHGSCFTYSCCCSYNGLCDEFCEKCDFFFIKCCNTCSYCSFHARYCYYCIYQNNLNECCSNKKARIQYKIYKNEYNITNHNTVLSKNKKNELSIFKIAKEIGSPSRHTRRKWCMRAPHYTHHHEENYDDNGSNLLRSLNAVKGMTSSVHHSRTNKRKLKKNLVWLFIGLVWLEGPKLINCSISHNNSDITSINGNETTNKIDSGQSGNSENSGNSSETSGSSNRSRNNSGSSSDTNGPGTNERPNAADNKSQKSKSNSSLKIAESYSAALKNKNIEFRNKKTFSKKYTLSFQRPMRTKKQFQYQTLNQDEKSQHREPYVVSRTSYTPKSNRDNPTVLLVNEEANRAQSDRNRLESIKRQILTKLGLTEKPNVTHPLPKQFIWDTIYRADGIRSVSDFDFNDYNHRTQEHMRLETTVIEPPPVLLSRQTQAIKMPNSKKKETKTERLNRRSEVKAVSYNRGREVSPSKDMLGSRWKLFNLTSEESEKIHQKALRKYRQQQQQRSPNNRNNIFRNKNRLYDPDYFEGDEFFGSTQEIITFAEKGKVYKKHRLVEFSPPSNKIPKQRLQIRNAEIHIRIEKVLRIPENTISHFKHRNRNHKLNSSKEPSLKIWIFRLIGSDFSRKGFDQVARLCTSLSVDHNVLGWQKLDITETVQFWYSKHQKDKLRLLIDCTGCGNRYILHLFDRKFHDSVFLPTTTVNSPHILYDKQERNYTITENSSVGTDHFDSNESLRHLYQHRQHSHHRYRRKNRTIQMQKQRTSDKLNELDLKEQTKVSHLPKQRLKSRTNRKNRDINNPHIKSQDHQLEGISYEVEADFHLEDRLNPNRPFLVLHTEPSRSRRVRRRAVDCSGAVHGQCCKESFYVSFKALGWDDWIIAPRGYFANYCRGDCTGPFRTPDTFQTFHAHFIEEYRKMGLLNGMQPCCAPVKFSSMSLIYYGDDGIIKRDLPKMVVDECGCP